MATISYCDDADIVALIDDLAPEQALAAGTDNVATSGTSIVYDPHNPRGHGDVVSGGGFTFDTSGNPTGGTVSGIDSGSGDTGSQAISITGLNLSLPELYQVSAAQAGSILLPQLLDGNDYFVDEVPVHPGQVLSGYAGDDTFYLPDLDGQLVDGGTGLDTAVIGSPDYGGLFDEYALTLSPGTVNLLALPGGQPGYLTGTAAPTATLSSVETMQFIDGSFWTDPATAGGQAYGLFQAILGRTPDSGSVGYWAGAVQQYGSVVAAAGLLASPEAQARLSGLDGAGFVSALYEGVLGRAPEAAGLAYWTAVLQSGVSRPVIVADIATSTEAHADLTPTFAAGVFGDNPAAVDVDRLYLAATGGLPTASQLAGYGGNDQSYGSLVTIANMLVSGDGSLSNTAFASLIQVNSYGTATTEATSYYASQLAAGAGTRGDVVMAYAFSPGIDTRVAPDVTSMGVKHS